MSRFTEEISQLPEALLGLTAYYRKEGRDRLEAWVKRVKGRSCLLFSGMGTSEFAPLVVRPRLTTVGINCQVLDAGEWLHYGAARPDDRGAVVLVSQSGESVELKKIIERHQAGGDFVGITNNPASTLGRSASLVLPMCAGAEASISTKTYSNTLGVLHLMAAALEGSAVVDEALGDLERVAGYLHSTSEHAITRVAAFLAPAPSLVFVGRGPAYVAARQCALTFMEGVRLHGSALTAGGFRHGPFEANGGGLNVVIFLPQGSTRTITEGIGREAAELGSRVVFITDADVAEDTRVKVIKIKNISGPASEDVFPLAASATHALLLHHLAAAHGIEAGRFQFGDKITTRE